LDYPTKLAVIVAKTEATSLCYVVEALYTQMWRKDVSDPYGVNELKRIIPEILWVRSYVWACIRQYPELWTRQGASLVKRFLESPLGLFCEDGKPPARPDLAAVAPDRVSALFYEARAGHLSGVLSA
jgi:hypothetical protein